ncbi:MAG TPA: prolyl oligopeptidase family serine peptidase [Vicinamibacterales bacterium]|nr:prolyl oligopeptidase family serine peptidase [Vicinamibacterales bacterium]
MRHFVCAAALALLPALAIIHAQEKVLATPPSVTTEGIPPIPQSVADGLARYAQFRQAQLMAWHPAKRQVLITTALGNTTQLYWIDGPLRYRRQLTWSDRSLPIFTNVAFDPTDPNTFFYQYDPDGAELRSLYRYDLATGESSRVTASKTRYPHVFARAGKWVAFDSAERNGRDRDLYVMLISDPATKRRVIEAEGNWSPQDWSPDGSTLLVNEVFANAETYLWTVDVKTGERKALTPRDGEKAAWFNPRFSADGRRVYALSDRQGGDFRLWRCEPANCKWTAATPEGMVVDAIGGLHGSAGFEFSSDGLLLAIVVDKGTSTELQILDVATMKPRTFSGLPRGLVSQLRWRPASREIAFTLGSIKSQGDVYSLDVALGTVTRWTSSEASFNPEVLPAPEVIEWKGFDGTPISGVLYRPAAKFSGPRPVLVNIHGGPDTSERARWQGRSNYFLNEMGIAIVFPNVRGSSGFGRKFQQMDDGRGREGAIKDIGALLDWIATRGDLDGNRIMLTGASYGGWLALEAGIHYNSRIRGIIAGAGITDINTYLETTDAARQDNRRQEFGDERDPQMREFLKSISPVTRAADLKKPTFILHPAKDIRVPVGQARELLTALKRNNAPVWYAEFADASHDNFPNTIANVSWMLNAWIVFIQSFLLN